MSGVVLRCPQCGTVKAGPGECEACSEASVRPFCTNHEPGRWLDGPACPQCGAKLGEAAPARPRAAPSRARPAPTPSPAPPLRRPAPAPEPSRPARTPWGRAKARPIPFDPRPEAPYEEAPRPATLPDLLRSARREGRSTRPTPAPPHPGSLIAGFIRRILFLILFLVLGLVVFGVLGGGPLLEILLTILLNSSSY